MVNIGHGSYQFASICLWQTLLSIALFSLNLKKTSRSFSVYSPGNHYQLVWIGHLKPFCYASDRHLVFTSLYNKDSSSPYSMQLYKLKLSYLCCPITFNQSASKFLRHNFHVVCNSLYSFSSTNFIYLDQNTLSNIDSF